MDAKSPRSYMVAPLAYLACGTRAELRSVRPTDRQVLGELMYRAYIGTIDYEGEDLGKCFAEVDRTMAGEYGVFDFASSVIAEVEHGIVASAVLLTRWRGQPFVAFVMTLPEYWRRGLARGCLLRAMQTLQLVGEHEIRLMVTAANARAVALYAALGFHFERPDTSRVCPGTARLQKEAAPIPGPGGLEGQ